VRAVTYSIVARDPASGELGVAVQSHFFSVGSVVTWARPGIGAVATQASARIDYGPRGLALMADGTGAPQALQTLLAEDPGAPTRQVAMVDARGGVAAFTGEQCIRYAGDVQSDEVSCQANIMAREGVPEAMLDAFLWESGSLAGRMLAALRAAEDAGGDLRGRQSAALLVVPGSGEPWETAVSLRVEDSADPLGELARLLALQAGYAAVSAADEASVAGDHDAAARGYRHAAELASESIELRFWAALGLAQAGDEEAALRQLRAVCAEDPAWRELLARLSAELAPSAPRLLDRLDRNGG
jgi:uncharacterized Ntn-hydrolase superfamily protein